MKIKSRFSLITIAVLLGITFLTILWQTFTVAAAQPEIPPGEPVMLTWAGKQRLTFRLLTKHGLRGRYTVDAHGQIRPATAWQRPAAEKPQQTGTDHNIFFGPGQQRLRWKIDLQHSTLLYDDTISHQTTILWQGPPLTVLAEPQWQPNGDAIIFTTAPYGSATLPESQNWIVRPRQAARRLPLPAGSHNLRWRPDGQAVAFVQSSNIGLYDPATRKWHLLWHGRINRPTVTIAAATNSNGPLTPPPFIRVLHRAENHCRAYAQPGEIDLIDFETYVAHVLPAEIYASWPTATLRAQAIAARTFAWYHIQHSQNDSWDVTDWVGYQMFCDDHQSPTNKAALDTTGEYMAYGNNLPILAQYSAQNGHPTLSLGSVPYLQSVPDPVDMGETRYGHGHGMSQIGAARWAYRHNWNVYQILHHYYTDIRIWRPPAAGLGPDKTPPRASLQRLDADDYLFGKTVPIAIDANDNISGVQAITLTAVNDQETTPTIIFSGTASSQPWRFDWQPHIPRSETRLIRIGGQVTDQAGNMAPVSAYTFTWEHEPPAIHFQTISETANSSVDIMLAPVAHLVGTKISFSRWAWQGENQLHQPHTGIIVADPGAENGQAWHFRAGIDSPGWLYGPYTDQIPAGAAYRAWFRLRGQPLPHAVDQIVARLDVTADQGRDLLGLRYLHGYDLVPDPYQDIPVDFYLFTDTSPDLEYRVRFDGQADLWIDRIAVATYPQVAASLIHYSLPSALGIYTITPFISSAGGLGRAAPPLQVHRYAPNDAVVWGPCAPAGWISSTNPVNISLTARGRGEPLAADTFRYRQKINRVWQAWISPTVPPVASGNVLQWQQPLALPEGKSAVQWCGADRSGHISTSPQFPLAVDRQPPTLSWQVPPPNSYGWYTAPLTLTIIATDTNSGLASIPLWQNSQPAGQYRTPIQLGADSNITWTARAVDVAGNLSSPITKTIQLDIAPPAAPSLSLQYSAVNQTILLHWQSQSAAAQDTFTVEMRSDRQTIWSRLLTDTKTNTLTVSGQRGHHYQFRVQQRATSGWRSNWRTAQITPPQAKEFLPWVNYKQKKPPEASCLPT